MGTASEEQSVGNYDPTYRQRDVDDTLEDHDSRISRLEKGALVGLGYALATAPEVVGQVMQFL